MQPDKKSVMRLHCRHCLGCYTVQYTIFPLIEAGSLIETGGGLRANTLPDW